LQRNIDKLNETNDNQQIIEQKWTDLQNIHQDLLDKQTKRELEYQAEKIAHEKRLHETTMECNMKIALMKSKS
jgi:hypothetical protein